MERVSLLWPDHLEGYEKRTFELGESTVRDLRLDEIAKHLNERRAEHILAVLTELPVDEQTIRYRQEVFHDLAENPELVEGFRALLPVFVNLDDILRKRFHEDWTLWRVLNRVRELDLYTQCVHDLSSLLERETIQSEGLCRLREVIGRIARDDAFRSLADNLPGHKIELNQIKSITLGINVNIDLEPEEAMLVSVNSTRFTESSRIQQLVATLGAMKNVDLSDLFGGLSRVHQLSYKTSNPMFSLTRDLNHMLKTVLRDMIGFLRKYARINTRFLVDMEPEIAFYISGLDSIRSLDERGFPFCRPTILSADDRAASLRDLHNLTLASRMATEEGGGNEAGMVYNDLDFGDSARVYVLTGPNRGGKTTVTAAVGQAQVFFQAGLSVPARRAAISPVDSLYTHFPTAESDVSDQGRLGEELARLRGMLAAVGRHSLVLLNESISSTGYTECLYISRDLLKAMKHLECRGVFNTHHHDLATCAVEINRDVPGNSRVESLVAGMEDGSRSYRVAIGPPLGSSYARDIALKHGISYEQIVRRRTHADVNASAAFQPPGSGHG